MSTIECSGLDSRGRSDFAAIAQRTHGMMTALTYAQGQQMADGPTQTILRQGGQVFISDRRLSDEERSEGPDVLARPRAAGTRRGGGEGAEGGSGRGYGAAPMPAPTNNIAGVITRRVQARASSMGVAY